MIRDTFPGAESARAVDDVAPFSGELLCPEDLCSEYKSNLSPETLQAMNAAVKLIRAHIDTLARVKPRNHADPDSNYLVIRQDAIDNLATMGDGADISSILDGEIDADTLYEFYDAASATQPMTPIEAVAGFIPPDERAMISAWNGMFINVLMVRYYMMQLAVQDPYAFRAEFNHKLLATSPKDKDAAKNHEALRLVAALDIGRGIDKSIILRMQADPDLRAYDGQSELSLYRQQYPEASQKIKDYIICMAVGVHAMGGTTCERLPSQGGLCKLAADRIDLSRFSPLERIVTSTLENGRREAVGRCERWAKAEKFPRLLDATYDPAEQQARKPGRVADEVPTVSKRAARQQKSVESARDIPNTPQELESAGPQFLTVSAIGGEIMDIDLSVDRELTLEATVQQLMCSDKIQKYIDEYDKNPGLIQFIEKALRAMLVPDEISSRSIQRLRKVRSVKVDGYSQKPYRLSGASLPGAGGGNAAQSTRILFSACNVGNKRMVTLRGIINRSDSRYGVIEDLEASFF